MSIHDTYLRIEPSICRPKEESYKIDADEKARLIKEKGHCCQCEKEIFYYETPMHSRWNEEEGTIDYTYIAWSTRCFNCGKVNDPDDRVIRESQCITCEKVEEKYMPLKMYFGEGGGWYTEIKDELERDGSVTWQHKCDTCMNG